MINPQSKILVLIYSLIFTFLLPASLIAQGRNQPEKLINLGRTNITTISVSSVNSSKSPHNKFYGAANLFDNDSNFINNINYNYWLTEPVPGPHWVNVEFSETVSIHRLNILLTGKIKKTINENLEDPNLDWVQKEVPDDWPANYSVEIQNVVGETLHSNSYGPIKIKGDKNSYKFKEPIDNVNAIRFIFPADDMIKVQEIQIFGVVKKPGNYSAKNPEIKTDELEIAKIGRTYLYGEVFDNIISGNTIPTITKTQKGWDYEIIMDGQVFIHLKLDEEGNIISKSYKILTK